MIEKAFMSDRSQILGAVRAFVRQQFPLARKRNLADSDDLLQSGVVDSLGVLEIVRFLEKEFSIAVADDELTPENFACIDAIASYIEQSDRIPEKRG